MTIDPRSLEAIRNPLAGLSNIGQMYAQGVEMKGRREDRDFRKSQALRSENQANAAAAMAQEKWTEEKKMNLLQSQLTKSNIEKAEMQTMYDQSRVMSAATSQIIEDIKANPALAQDPNAYSQYIQESTKDLPDSIAKKIMNVPIDQIERINRRSKRMGEALNDKVSSPNYETISVQNKKTGNIDTYRKNDPRVDKLIGGGTHIKYFPSTKGTKGDSNLQKKTRGKLEDRALFAADLQDSIGKVTRLFESGGKEKLTYGDRAYDYLAENAEKLGIDITDKAKGSVGLRQQMQGQIIQVQSNWRRAITGTQASKFELNDIKGQVFQLEDGATVFETKLKSWKDTSDRMAVRTKRALDAGFKHTGEITKDNGDVIPIYTNNEGENRSLSSFGALGEIPTMKEYMMKELQSAYPKEAFNDMSKQERQEAIRKITNQANLLGYR